MSTTLHVMAAISSPLLYWRHKHADDNDWHPVLRTPQPAVKLSSLARRIDPEAAVVDVAPITFAAGTAAYLRQLPQLGVTAPASPFRNIPTLLAFARSSNIACLAITAAQVAGVEYRYYIPRWAHDRERRRDDKEAREHVSAGMIAGSIVLVLRNFIGLGPRSTRRTVMDIILGGALADVCLREYYRAHNM